MTTKAALAFCEHSSATPYSLEHIRRVGPEGLLEGGGAPDTTLCGAPLRGGWDLVTPVTADRVELLATPRSGDGRVFLCGECADAYRSLFAKEV